MRAKNSPFLGRFFSFHAYRISLMLFLVQKSMSRFGSPQSPFFKLVTFLRSKGEQKSHDSKNAPKTALYLHKLIHI